MRQTQKLRGSFMQCCTHGMMPHPLTSPLHFLGAPAIFSATAASPSVYSEDARTSFSEDNTASPSRSTSTCRVHMPRDHQIEGLEAAASQGFTPIAAVCSRMFWDRPVQQ